MHRKILQNIAKDNVSLRLKRKFNFFSLGGHKEESKNGKNKDFTPDIGPMVPGRKRSKPVKVRLKYIFDFSANRPSKTVSHRWMYGISKINVL